MSSVWLSLHHKDRQIDVNHAHARVLTIPTPAIEAWAKVNGRESDFWQWRDSLDLVPHEDTGCRTMRLVYRPVHNAFKHRGGVANALNIKSHFYGHL